MLGGRLEIHRRLESRHGQHVHVDQHGGADQGRDQAAEKDRFPIKKGVKKDSDTNADTNIDDAADFQAFARPDTRNALLLAQELDRGLAPSPGASAMRRIVSAR